MSRSKKRLYCEKCLLQFDKKIVYDIHQSFVHKVEIEEKIIQIKEENKCLEFHCDNKNQR